MAFTSVTEAEIANGQFVTHSLLTKVKDNFDALHAGMAGVSGLSNGSFEIDSDNNGSPDNWTITLYSGGSSALYTTAPAHGATALSFVHPGGSGNGGGYADSDYFEVDGVSAVMVTGIHWVTAAGMKCEVIIKWYTAAKVGISDTTLFSSTSNPTAAIRTTWTAFPPSTARYAKLEVVGGKSDTNVAGTAYFDGFTCSPLLAMPVHANAADTFTLASGATASTQATSWTKLKEYVCTVAGQIRISFSLSGTGGATAYGRIYRNGSAVGTSRSATGATTYSEDIGGWKPGDLIQVYGYVSNASYYANFSAISVTVDIFAPVLIVSVF